MYSAIYNTIYVVMLFATPTADRRPSTQLERLDEAGPPDPAPARKTGKDKAKKPSHQQNRL